MADIGELVIKPEEALAKAGNIRNYAGTVHSILDELSKKMNEIDNDSSDVYRGTAKAEQLREQLNKIIENFEPIYTQIMAFASQIEEVTAHSKGV